MPMPPMNQDNSQFTNKVGLTKIAVIVLSFLSWVLLVAAKCNTIFFSVTYFDNLSYGEGLVAITIIAWLASMALLLLMVFYLSKVVLVMKKYWILEIVFYGVWGLAILGVTAASIDELWDGLPNTGSCQNGNRTYRAGLIFSLFTSFVMFVAAFFAFQKFKEPLLPTPT
eukprot:m.34134 g.34134  ORF g.34134 m.34134 type:complete len:169 (-) comp6500_c2_seq1:1035-1541(-)